MRKSKRGFAHFLLCGRRVVAAFPLKRSPKSSFWRFYYEKSHIQPGQRQSYGGHAYPKAPAFSGHPPHLFPGYPSLLQHCGQLLCQRHAGHGRGDGHGGLCHERSDPGLSHPDAHRRPGRGHWRGGQRPVGSEYGAGRPRKGWQSGWERLVPGGVHLCALPALRPLWGASLSVHPDQ